MKELEHIGAEVPLQEKSMTEKGHGYRIASVVNPDRYRSELIERGATKVGG